jgi:hypothetical protein
MVEGSMVEEVIDRNVLRPISFEDFVPFDSDLATSVVYDTLFH